MLMIFREIVDESDVYVDVHKAIRRLTPAPRARRIHAEGRKAPDSTILVDVADHPDGTQAIKVGSYQSDFDGGFHNAAKTAIYMKRRTSGAADGHHPDGPPVRVKQDLDEMRQQLRLGPANRAARPLSNTRKNLFKIKQGLGVTPSAPSSGRMPPRSASAIGVAQNERTPLLGPDDLDHVAESAGEEYGSPKSKSKLNGKRAQEHDD